MATDPARLARIIQALILIILINMVAISGYYMIHAMLNDTQVPLMIRVTFVTGTIVFVLGLAYVIWERVQTRKTEDFRRVKW